MVTEENPSESVAGTLAELDLEIANLRRLSNLARECGFSELAASICADLSAAYRVRDRMAADGFLLPRADGTL